MSTERYASLHGGLIARKGEAQPSPTISMDSYVVDRMLETSVPASKPAPQSCDMPASIIKPVRPKRITEDSKAAGMKALTFRLDPALYHRVQVAAAKLGWTAQDLMRSAVEEHLINLATDIFPNCGCIMGKDSCN